jgi:hypothetical protein
LREQHEEAVEAFVEEGIAFGFEKLKAEVWYIVRMVSTNSDDVDFAHR